MISLKRRCALCSGLAQRARVYRGLRSSLFRLPASLTIHPPTAMHASPDTRAHVRPQAIEDDEFVETIAPFLSTVKSEMLLIKDRIDQLTDDYDELAAAYEENKDDLPVDDFCKLVVEFASMFNKALAFKAKKQKEDEKMQAKADAAAKKKAEKKAKRAAQ